VSDPIRVVVAEDSVLVREGIAGLIGRAPDLELVGLCGDLDALLAAVESLAPDVVLTDIRMPPTGTDEGIRAAASIHASHPETAVLVLSHHLEPALALELLETGTAGRGYLLKERVGDGPELVAAIRTVAGGGAVVDPEVMEILVASHRARSSSALDPLTPRELDVLGEIALGKNNAAIADSLVLSERSVEKHINSVFWKLGLSDLPDVNRRVMAVLVYLQER
jgi:DNA-binding NarL/FixJ family response regulator